ncbi:MAG TPA: hypothetical protein VH540_13035 [Ktedonobacterales bacterium]
MARLFSSDTQADKRDASLAGGTSALSFHIPNRTKALLLVLHLPILWIVVVTEVALLLVALVPESIWASYGYPNGPIPHALSPLVAGAFYVLPAVTGLLCRRWYVAIILATLPAWLDLGLFAVAAAGRIGPFYLAQDPHVVSTISTLELFGVLGAVGWLTRRCLLDLPLLRGTSVL